MEEHFGTLFSGDIIKKETSQTTCSFKKMKKIIVKAEMKITIKKCGEKSIVTLPN